MLYFDPHSTRAGTAGFEGIFFFFAVISVCPRYFLIYWQENEITICIFFPGLVGKGRGKLIKHGLFRTIYTLREKVILQTVCDFVWIQCWTPDFVAHHVKWMYDLYHRWWGGRLFLVYQLFTRTLLKSFILINIFSLTFSSWLKLAIT